MISQTAEYALRAVVFLINRQNAAVRRAEIAAAICVSSDYLHKILQSLARAGIVATQRGPGGGYYLTADVASLTVWDVYSVVDELPRIRRCPLGISSHEQLCPLHAFVDNLAQSMEDALKTVRMVDLVSGKSSPKSCRFPPLQP